MNARTGRHLFASLLILALTAGCAGLGRAPLPTQPPGVVETIIAATFAAAEARTQASFPTETETPLPSPTISDTPGATATPSITMTPSKTLTPTITTTPVWVLPTWTTFPTMTKMGIQTVRPSTGGGSTTTTNTKVPAPTPNPYKCTPMSQQPSNNVEIKAGTAFDVIWTVKNTGSAEWELHSVDLLYASGTNMEKIAETIIDIPITILVGETLAWDLDMIAPAAPGLYTTNWTMNIGRYNKFCPLSLTIKVIP